MKKITQNSYYLGLYDLDIVDYTNKNGSNVYKKVDWRKSGNQEYFIIIDKKLQERGNWYRLNDKQVLNTSLIDFCFSNWCKLQTNRFKDNILKQGYHIINDTINSIKHNIRHLNRFVNDSTAFNLIAYDTMLDDENNLNLIEINRGSDLHGLKLTLGENKITNIFSELFDIVIDRKPEEELKYFKKYKLEY
jgi:hypothetical protein